MIRVKTVTDFKRLGSLETLDASKSLGPTMVQLAAAVVDDVNKNWWPTSPSPPHGNPPAKVSGDLESSVVIGAPRDTKGRFAGSRGATMVVIEYTEEYAAVHELGFRPFLEPAIDRANGVMVEEFKKWGKRELER